MPADRRSDSPADEVRCDSLEDLRRRLSAKWQTYPHDVLPLTVAEMDYALAPPVATALREALERSDTGYATVASGLGEALAGFANRRWSWPIDPASVTAVGDTALGVIQLIRVLTGPGDAVVINTPVYHPFFEWIPEAGAEIVEVPLAVDETGWRLDLERLETAFARQPAVYLLCNPHNPVGRVHRPEELASVVELATRYGVTIISDEIHGPLVLTGASYRPMLTIDGASEVTISVVSASKAWNLAGLKCALVVTGSRAMASIVERFPLDARWRTGHWGVLAAMAAFTEGEEWLDQLLKTLKRRRTELDALLAARLPMVSWFPPDATYLAWLDCRAIGSDWAPRDLFLDRGRVALEGGPRFGTGGSGFVRLNFATSSELLEEAVDRMAEAL